MPVNLSELSAEVSEPLVVEVGTDAAPASITVRYRPNAITPALEDRIFAVSQRSQVGAVYRMMLADTLASWDVEGTLPPLPEATDSENEKRGAGGVLPITVETLSLLPITVLEKIVVAIQGAQSPKKSTSTSSRSSFGAAA